MIYDNNSEIIFCISMVLSLVSIIVTLFMTYCAPSALLRSLKIPKLSKYFRVKLAEHECLYSKEPRSKAMDTAASENNSFSFSYAHNDSNCGEGDFADMQNKSSDLSANFLYNEMRKRFLIHRIYIALIFVFMLTELFVVIKTGKSVYIDTFDICNKINFLIAIVSAGYLMFCIFCSLIFEYDMEPFQDKYQSYVNALAHVFSCMCVREQTGQTGLIALSSKYKPLWLKTNVKHFFLRTSRCKVFFLPDKIYVFGKKFSGIYDYSKVKVSCQKNKITEYGITYKDEEIIGKEWEHQTKSGKPDLRYKNNPSYNVCLCGEVTIDFGDGHSIVLVTSNHSIIDDLQKSLETGFKVSR